MKKFFKNYRVAIIVFILSLLATAFFCYPYLNKLDITAHDIDFHLTRIQQISIGLEHGQFPVMIHEGLLNEVGYGNSLFYPEIFLYIPAILHLLGISTLMAYKFYILQY